LIVQYKLSIIMSTKTKSAVAIYGSKTTLESMIPTSLCSVKETGVWGICIFPMNRFTNGLTNFDQASWYKFETKDTGAYREGKFVKCTFPNDSLTKEIKKPNYLASEVGSYLVSRRVFNEDDYVLCVGYYDSKKKLGDFQFGISGTVEYVASGHLEDTSITCSRECSEETGIEINSESLTGHGRVRLYKIPVYVYTYHV
jgi:hypothetical protein